jgi:hypothetical protein
MARMENRSFQKLALPLREPELTLPVGIHIRHYDEAWSKTHQFYVPFLLSYE